MTHASWAGPLLRWLAAFLPRALRLVKGNLKAESMDAKRRVAGCLGGHPWPLVDSRKP